MILSFKEKFEDGTATNFKQQILEGNKIHSLRESERWHKGYFIHMANGVRTKHYNQFNTDRPDLQRCISVQRVFMTCTDNNEITVGDKYLMAHEVDLLIKNDGLTREQFINWFFPKEVDEWSGQIIHWTDFKY